MPTYSKSRNSKRRNSKGSNKLSQRKKKNSKRNNLKSHKKKITGGFVPLKIPCLLNFKGNINSLRTIKEDIERVLLVTKADDGTYTYKRYKDQVPYNLKKKEFTIKNINIESEQLDGLFDENTYFYKIIIEIEDTDEKLSSKNLTIIIDKAAFQQVYIPGGDDGGKDKMKPISNQLEFLCWLSSLIFNGEYKYNNEHSAIKCEIISSLLKNILQQMN